MSEVTIVITIIFIFTFVPLILAEIARNKSFPSIDDFFICNRSISAVYYFFTVYATWYSTFAVMGSSAHFYMNGPVYMTTFAWNILFAVLLYIIGRRVWFYGKKNGYITPTDFFNDIYQSKVLTLIVTVILLVFTLPYIQIQFSGGAYLIDIASGGKIPWEMAGLIFYMIMVVYLWAGGLRAVAMTDIFFGILVFIALVGTGLLLTAKAGGISNIFSTLLAEDKSNVTLSGKNPLTNILTWFSMFIITPLGALMSPPMWIRNYSVKKEKTFMLIPFLIAIAAVGYIGCFLAGNAGKILNPNITDTNTLIPTLLTNHGGAILTTILFCGFAAASLSTANSQIHSLAAIYTIDIYKRFINKNASDNKYLYIAKWAVLSFSVIAYIFMIMSPSIIISTGLLALSGTAQIIVPVVGALFWKKSNANGAIAGLLCGTLSLIVLYGYFNLDASYCGIIALSINTIVFITICQSNQIYHNTYSKIVKYKKNFDEH